LPINLPGSDSCVGENQIVQNVDRFVGCLMGRLGRRRLVSTVVFNVLMNPEVIEILRDDSPERER
jgi:hypothetical protein